MSAAGGGGASLLEGGSHKPRKKRSLSSAADVAAGASRFRAEAEAVAGRSGSCICGGDARSRAAVVHGSFSDQFVCQSNLYDAFELQQLEQRLDRSLNVNHNPTGNSLYMESSLAQSTAPVTHVGADYPDEAMDPYSARLLVNARSFSTPHYAHTPVQAQLQRSHHHISSTTPEDQVKKKSTSRWSLIRGPFRVMASKKQDLHSELDNMRYRDHHFQATAAEALHHHHHHYHHFHHHHHHVFNSACFEEFDWPMSPALNSTCFEEIDWPMSPARVEEIDWAMSPAGISGQL